MNTGILLGILLIAIGAFSSGSFAVPFGKIKVWEWETYWTVFSLGAYVLFPLMAGVLWFGQFIVYGMGKSKMGPFAFTSWGILMALTIVFATVWSLLRNEWKGAPTKIYILMVLSLLIIIASSFLIGISGEE